MSSATGIFLVVLLTILLVFGVFIYHFFRDRKLLKSVTSLKRGTASERDLVLRLLKKGMPAITIFHDLCIEKRNGSYSQIDIVLPTKEGIVVFEVKDYAGWIFGDGHRTTWMKTLNYGKIKNRFYNTIKISDDGALIATIRVGNNADDNTFAIKYIVGDHLNNSTAVLKTTGTLINREDTREENARWAFDSKGTRVAHPFGETSFGGFQYKRYRYNGKEKDEENGLYEYGQRYYAPWLCKFTFGAASRCEC